MSARTENIHKMLFLKVPPTSTPILNRGCDSVITICVHNIISINPLTHHLRPIVFPQAFRKPQGANSGLNSRPLCLAQQRPITTTTDAPVAVPTPLRPLSAHRRQSSRDAGQFSNRSADRHPIKWRVRRIAARFVSANLYRRTRPDRTSTQPIRTTDLCSRA